MCGIEVHYAGNTITAIKGDMDDPFSEGHICPKATALEDVYHDKNRLKHPVKRTENGWEEISWEQAFDEVTDNLLRIQAQHGNNAVGVYLGNPNSHNAGSIIYAPAFIRALKTKNRFSATSVDQLPHHFASYFMYGHQLLLPIPDVDHTDYFLMLGANPLASNGSLMTAGGIERRLKVMQKRGGKLIVLDPRKTETAKLANEHHFIKPAADVFFLLAMVNVIFSDDLVQLGHLAPMIDEAHLHLLRDAVADFTPENTASQTGISAEALRRITHDFASAEKAVCYGRVGLSMQSFGGLCQWLINVVNILTGNLDSVGGSMFTQPAFDVVGFTTMLGQTGSYDRWRSRVRDLPEFGGELPVSVLAEEILTEGEGQMKALVTVAGNPVLSTPNGTQLEKALESLDYMVAVDIYINETSRHANIILPSTTGLETEHYDAVFHVLAVRNSAKYSHPMVEVGNDRRHDWQIFQSLANGLDIKRGAKAPNRKDYLRRMSLGQLLDFGIRMGPHGLNGGRKNRADGLTLKRLKAQPHGVDLGALQPCLKDRIATPNRKISLIHDHFLADLPRARAVMTAPLNGHDLLLIGRRHVRSNNSWMHNSERLVKGKNRCTLMINPHDAHARGIGDGSIVMVESRVGKVEIPAEVTTDIMQGVVSIPHGFGHTRAGVQLDVATQHAGVSINDLTDDKAIDPMTGNAAFSATPVQVACK
jgi:anaerobic selenocysteine-containing dehydrogenase